MGWSVCFLMRYAKAPQMDLAEAGIANPS